jgi:predicted secreted protein
MKKKLNLNLTNASSMDKLIKEMQSAGNGPEQEPENKLFRDKRSKRVIFVSHCILNQNAMIDKMACFSGPVPEVVDTILASGCGIIQLDCPELVHMGLDRAVDLISPRTTGSEDTRVRVGMEKGPGRTVCRKIAERIAWQMEQYNMNGFHIAGVLGINDSPTCGVETTWINGNAVAGQGVFIEELLKELNKRKLIIPIRGINLSNPVESKKITSQFSGFSS